jgi:secreted Zn-dependent insulinase-like peptidase
MSVIINDVDQKAQKVGLSAGGAARSEGLNLDLAGPSSTLIGLTKTTLQTSTRQDISFENESLRSILSFHQRELD